MMKILGTHSRTTLLDGTDGNGRFMVKCLDCGTCAHEYTVDQAQADLAQNTTCAPTCKNCHNLRHSCGTSPAVPLFGQNTDLVHVCPIDGNRWRQSNGYFHLWNQVTSTKEWEALLDELQNPSRHDD
jgi:hypothetical protein